MASNTCRFGVHCTKGAQCPFVHPDVKTISTHCKYGDACRRADCYFLHPHQCQESGLSPEEEDEIWDALEASLIETMEAEHTLLDADETDEFVEEMDQFIGETDQFADETDQFVEEMDEL